MEIKELTSEEFMAFSEDFPVSSLYQTSEYAMTMNNQQFDSFYLGMFDDSNNLVAASLIMVELLSKFKYAYAPSSTSLLTTSSCLSLFTKPCAIVTLKFNSLFSFNSS